MLREDTGNIRKAPGKRSSVLHFSEKQSQVAARKDTMKTATRLPSIQNTHSNTPARINPPVRRHFPAPFRCIPVGPSSHSRPACAPCARGLHRYFMQNSRGHSPSSLMHRSSASRCHKKGQTRMQYLGSRRKSKRSSRMPILAMAVRMV